MNIFILCAGLGKRLEHKTLNKPKCLVEVNKIPILQRLLEQLKQIGIRREKIILCSGYLNNQLPKEYTQLHNDLYSSTNMIYTLFKALNNFDQNLLLKEDSLIIYGDCLYDIEILSLISNYHFSKEDVLIPIDQNWKEQWKMRYDNPYDDAETLIYDKKNMKLLNIGEKTLKPDDYMGQFMGIFKIKNNSMKLFIKEYKNLTKTLQNNISSTEFINLSLNKIFYKVIPLEFKWSEVDNLTDLAVAESKF